MGRVLVVGSLNRDLVVRTPRLPGPGETVLADGLDHGFGGKGANQAVAAAATGAPTILIGAVGADDAGRAYRRRLADLGITARLAERPDTPTGLAVVAVDSAGENSILVVAGANATVSPELVADGLADLASDDVALVQLELPLPAVRHAIGLARAAGARVVLNLAPFADLPGTDVAYADPVVVNAGEAKALCATGRAPGSLVTTRGADGASWGAVSVPAAPADVVDTTGAGDAFCGGLAAALLAGATREQALLAASRSAAAVLGHRGAQP